MSKKEEKKRRVCGYCGGIGHNVRTCAKKKEDIAAGRLQAAEAEKPLEGEVDVPVAAPSRTEVVRGSNIQEYQETARTVELGGSSIRLSLRTAPTGQSDIGMLVSRNGKTSEVHLSLDEAKKAFELLNWAIQQHQVVQSRTRQLQAVDQRRAG